MNNCQIFGQQKWSNNVRGKRTNREKSLNFVETLMKSDGALQSDRVVSGYIVQTHTPHVLHLVEVAFELLIDEYRPYY